MRLSLRTAGIDDAGRIAELMAELGYPATAAAVADRLQGRLGDPRYLALLAVDQHGQVLGWLSGEQRLSVEYGDYHEVTGLVVCAQAQRQGVGQVLLRGAQAWVAAAGGCELRVRSNAARQASHRFYQANGFTAWKTQVCYRKPVAAAAVDAGSNNRYLPPG